MFWSFCAPILDVHLVLVQVELGFELELQPVGQVALGLELVEWVVQGLELVGVVGVALVG